MQVHGGYFVYQIKLFVNSITFFQSPQLLLLSYKRRNLHIKVNGWPKSYSGSFGVWATVVINRSMKRGSKKRYKNRSIESSTASVFERDSGSKHGQKWSLNHFLSAWLHLKGMVLTFKENKITTFAHWYKFINWFMISNVWILLQIALNYKVFLEILTLFCVD